MPDALDRWTQAQSLFERALGRPAEERTAWLRATCGDDPDLYAEVAALLDGDARGLSLLDGSAADALGADAFEAAILPSRAGERVGPWVLGERIGVGGMGAVYRAEREGGFEQTAALKRIKRGMDSEAVIARFRAERQILARLQHPGIARLLGGGLDADGRPYFAMELVEGEPITAWCDARRADLDTRLALFERVCEAVAYAHRALVVHRDLKPSNVLVADGDDGAPTVKLLDFGIARVLDDADGELTQTGQRVFTPGYAAPEQVRGEAPTTSTDVYALGVLLYRLVAGARPIRTAERSPIEIERAVLEEAPQRPSTAVTSDAAAARGTTDAALARRLQGDLDTICLTAVRKEPERRYGSAAELLADVRRFRQGFPIEARPATRRYRAGLFVQRNRGAVLGSAAALAALVALAAFYTVRLTGERDRAEIALDRQAAVSGFLADLLQAASPRQSQDREVSVRDVLDQARESVGELADRPAVYADVLDVLGSTYYQINDYAAAVPLQRRALALRLSLPGTPDSVVADAYNRVGMSFRNGSQPDSAIAYFEAGLAVARSRLGEDDFWNVTLLNNLTDPYVRTGQHAKAEATSREVVAIDRRTLGADDPVRSFGLNNLAMTLANQGRFGEAEPLLRESLQLLREGSGGRNLSYGAANLGSMLTQAGRPDEALPLVREALALRIEAVGTNEQFVGEAFKFVADALSARGAPGDYAAADSLYRRALAVYDATVEPDHLAYAYTWYALGRLRLRQGRPAEASRQFRRSVDLRRSGTDAPRQLARSLLGLGDALSAGGDLEAAAAHYREALQIAEAALPERDWVWSEARARVGLADQDADLYRGGLTDLAGRVGRGHPAVLALCARGRARGVSSPVCEAPPR